MFDRNNPHLKHMLFTQMREMGIQPEQYIVGNELNSINPVTGQPEFFLKKIGKGLKKALKKLAPIIGFAVGAYLTPKGAGRGLSSFIPGVTTGLATKLAGGSTGKSIAYGGLGALAGGTLLGRQGMITGTQPLAPSQDFSRKFTGTLNKPLLAPVDDFSVPYDARRAPVFKGEPDFRKTIPFNPEPAWEKGGLPAYHGGDLGRREDLSIQPNLKSYPTIHEGKTDLLPNIQSDQGGLPPSLSQIYEGIPSGQGGVDDIIKATMAELPPNQRTLEVFTDIGKLKNNSLFLQMSSDQRLTMLNIAKNNAPITPATNPWWKSPWVVGAGLGGLGILAAKEAKQDKLDLSELMTALEAQRQMGGQTGFDLLASNPSQYGFDPRNFVPFGDTSALPPDVLAKAVADFGVKAGKGGYIDVVHADQGGEIVGPGTGTSDNVPAMLSDGEFVMTANAVKGAGNGNRREGARKMYQMMKRFEGATGGLVNA